MSIRRACKLLQANRSTYHYVSIGPTQADLKKRIKEIAETRVRYGYRRIHVLLRREGWPVYAKRVYRLYRELGLQLRSKAPKRKVKIKLREGRADPGAEEQCLGAVDAAVYLKNVNFKPNILLKFQLNPGLILDVICSLIG